MRDRSQVPCEGYAEDPRRPGDAQGLSLAERPARCRVGQVGRRRPLWVQLPQSPLDCIHMLAALPSLDGARCDCGVGGRRFGVGSVRRRACMGVARATAGTTDAQAQATRAASQRLELRRHCWMSSGALRRSAPGACQIRVPGVRTASAVSVRPTDRRGASVLRGRWHAHSCKIGVRARWCSPAQGGDHDVRRFAGDERR